MTDPAWGVDALADRLASARVVPVLRTDTAGAALEAAARCYAAGLPLVELTTTTPGWEDALRWVRRDFPERTVGVGTVLTAAQASAAADAGAHFLVSPRPVPGARQAVAGRLPFVEGGMTVAEVLDAAARGVAKLFPAHVGGPQYLRSILAVAPGSRIVPTGGIALAEVPQWLRAGALAVGVGSDLLAAPDLEAALREVLDRG